MKEDALCLYAECELGDMDIGKDVTIEMEVEMNSGVLDISPVRTVQCTNCISFYINE